MPEAEPGVRFVSEVVELEGHLIDSLILAKVLDIVLAAGADYELLDVDIGKTSRDASHARIEIRAASEAALSGLLVELQGHGVNRASDLDARLEPAPEDGVLPAGFYSTTNLPTSVRVERRWVEADRFEMDCALVVDAVASEVAVRTVPMHRIRAGDRVVVGHEGVRVRSFQRARGTASFEFMTSEVSSEKPKGLVVRRVADRVRNAMGLGLPGAPAGLRRKVLVVAGPAVIHTGAGPALARLVREGWVDLLFAGNGFAAHDIESNVLGTSLGIDVTDGTPVEGGHANHLRAINEVRRHGSIRAAVEVGWLRGGVLYECVRRGVPFVLAGSLRDDGPLPDVYADVLQAADAMREQVVGVGVALMLASTLHAVATGNLISADVESFCVDINQAVATKLTDRGSHEALGIVTDVGLFVTALADELCSGSR